ncbi:putative secreted protein [Wickerhamomyces ciferrii]|uniref:Long chronological lifespan protein 2 n=1 Tax=Wickerhamomyces ciferrii (strain ATCC 14091 / BCRC 22168 / CBS 111 / JCM 3599 / NBRC 0793 / NRRL Y-1031 F-60-10) TaxID=1206466 RepID=K0L034_WICCF|nr:uncharacterized protein BN7_6346 [Wickerhamomyces ciferrii]CCH46748.1 putative secreted protein [Wickerhamomyces ciferrii]
MMSSKVIMQYFVVLVLALQVNAQFFEQFFGGGSGGARRQQQRQEQLSYEDEFLGNKCDGYLCPDTKACVKTKIECPCPFPKSQLKCVLPNKENYVCISKPATNKRNLQKIYDDPKAGPKARSAGLRDCGWVEDAWNGLV